MRRISTVLLPVAAVSMLAACSDPFAPLPSGPPAHFEFGISSWGLESRRWTVRGDTLVITTVDWDGSTTPDTVRTIPTSEEWAGFWQTANLAGIRKWRGNYSVDGLADGTAWGLSIRNADLRIDAQGSNAYPDRNGNQRRNDPTPEFAAVVAALERLAQ